MLREESKAYPMYRLQYIVHTARQIKYLSQLDHNLAISPPSPRGFQYTLTLMSNEMFNHALCHN